MDLGINISRSPCRPTSAAENFLKLSALDEAPAQHEAPVVEQKLAATGFAAGEVALLQGSVLVEEAVVGGDQHVGDVGIGQLLEDGDQLVQRLLHGLKDPLLAVALVAYGVNAVVVDVDHLMVAEKRTALLAVQAQQLVSTQGRGAAGQGPIEDLLAVLDALRTVAVDQHGAVVGDGKGLVGQAAPPYPTGCNWAAG